jgi:hypothetical protein
MLHGVLPELIMQVVDTEMIIPEEDLVFTLL